MPLIVVSEKGYMQTKTWSEIAKAWIATAVAGGVGWLVAHGAVPDAAAPVLQSKATQAALAVSVALMAAVQQIRASLRAEAARLLPANASSVDVEVKMAELGYRHVLMAVRQQRRDDRYDELRTEFLHFKADFEAFKARSSQTSTSAVSGGVQ